MEQFIPKFNRAQKAWFGRLESGKYKQSRKTLYCGPKGWEDHHGDPGVVEGGMCCLGVACVPKYPLAKLDGMGDLSKEGGSNFEPVRKALCFESASGDTLDWAPGRERRVKLFSCIHMNDAQRMTFEQISQHLQKHGQWYFTNINKQYNAWYEKQRQERQRAAKAKRESKRSGRGTAVKNTKV